MLTCFAVGSFSSYFIWTLEGSVSPIIPHLQGDRQNNGDGSSLEKGDERQLKTAHDVVRLPQEQEQTQTGPHHAEQSHKSEASP